MKRCFLPILLCGLAGCATVKDNPVLQQLADWDQQDRRQNVAAMTSHDVEHQRQVYPMIAAKQLRTSQDYFNAAIVLQHADSARDYRLAHEFAKKAVALNSQNTEAKTLIAQSWDRYQRRLGLPQWYGTQHQVIGTKEYLQPIDTTKVTDTERAALFVNTLPQRLAYFNKLYGKHETSVTKYVLTNERRRELEDASGLRVELIGTYDSLFSKANYPARAAQNNIKGFVTIEATIDEQGRVSRADVVRGLGYGCDEEAARLLRSASFTNLTGAPHDIRVQVPFGPPIKP